MHIYSRASAKGKRVQCNMGVKNHAAVKPVADPEEPLPALVGASLGLLDSYPWQSPLRYFSKIQGPTNKAWRVWHQRIQAIICRRPKLLWEAAVHFFTQIKTVTSQWNDSDLQGVSMAFPTSQKV
ncbi:unnamed protein product [Sphagnum tenellum]